MYDIQRMVVRSISHIRISNGYHCWDVAQICHNHVEPWPLEWHSPYQIFILVASTYQWHILLRPSQHDIANSTLIIHPTSQNGGSNIWYRNVSIVFQIDFHHVSIHQQLLYDYSGMDIISRGWYSCASHGTRFPQHVEYQIYHSRGYTVTSTIVLPP